MNLTDRDLIWHPFTAQKDAPEPIHIERGEGSWIYASDGRKFIDAVSSWWVNIHGHAQPYIARRIAEQALQLEHVIFAGFTHTPAIDLARHLLEMLPGKFSKVFFSDNGSTAVEVALKMAVQYWFNNGQKKNKIIAFENAYHGDTFGAMSAGGRSTFTAAFDSLLFDVIHIPVPRENNIESCKSLLKQYAAGGDVAAFIFEPLVQGTAGMVVYSPEHLDEMLATAKELDIICIADEVMTGFGRTGKLFACDHLEKRPDIICLSKGITGGFMPLGVTVCNEKIYQAFYSDDRTKTFYHGHSYTANPLACAAAVASIELLKDPACLQQIDMIGRKHTAFCKEIQQEENIAAARHCGTIMAIELKTAEGSSYFSSIRNKIYDACLERGVLLRPLGNIIYCMPPYCINEQELDLVYDTMRSIGKMFR